MPNIASILKSEIARIVRKELRSEFQATKKAVSAHRSQIAELKRQVKSLEQQLKKASRGERKAGASRQTEQAEQAENTTIRFSAKGLASQRKRLGLSVAATAKLLDVSAQSVINWESGKTRPRDSQLAAIAALRKMGKKEAAARLA